MDEIQLIGYSVMSIITLGSFIAIVTKFTQPINDLRIVIQKLNDRIDSMNKDSERQEERINKHGEQLDKLDGRVGTLETKMKVYHNEK